MISLIEALNYRCLRYVRQPLGPFHVLIGANASGKTTFLDVVAFLGRLLKDGLEAAIEERTTNFFDLTWNRAGQSFEIAIEASLPAPLATRQHGVIRYEIAIGGIENGPFPTVGIIAEQVYLKPAEEEPDSDEAALTDPMSAPRTILKKAPRSWRVVVSKATAGNDTFKPESPGEKGKPRLHAFKLGPRKSALASLPPDADQFPATTWLKELLAEGVQPVVLNSQLLKKPSPPHLRGGLQTDGSNLPWIVDQLRGDDAAFEAWLAHLRTSLTDLVDIDSRLRAEDRHRYLVLKYATGVEVPAWTLSDGTLRLLALTMLAYRPRRMAEYAEEHGQGAPPIYLIEEPENGIHPSAIETVFQSLASVYEGQVLMASHSPVLLGVTPLEAVLCFARNSEGATEIVPGPRHPRLRDWKHQTSLGDLFASGVLG